MNCSFMVFYVFLIIIFTFNAEELTNDPEGFARPLPINPVETYFIFIILCPNEYSAH